MPVSTLNRSAAWGNGSPFSVSQPAQTAQYGNLRVGQEYAAQNAAPTGPTMPGSFNPAPVYTPRMTGAGTNLAVAEQHQAGNLPHLMKAFDRPGVSRDAGQMSAAMPQVAQHNIQAAKARAGIPLDDLFANQQNLLRGQLGGERERLGYLGLAISQARDRMAAQGQGFGNAATFADMMMS